GSAATVVVVLAWPIVTFSVLDVLVTSLASPAYTATIEWSPDPRFEVVKLAVNPVGPALSVPDPSVLAPSMKLTVPVGDPAPGLTTPTVAVSVTDCPITGDGTEELSAVLVESFPTFRLIDAPASPSVEN